MRLIPASTLVAILAAQDAFAPSQTIPEIFANVFVTVLFICSNVPPSKYVIAAPLAHPALTAPQNAESLPIPVFGV